jgi:rod shape determining protein RodA
VEIQPSAFLKVAFILTFSKHLHWLNRDGENRMNQIKHMALLCLHGMLPIGIILVQKDMGTAMVILGIFLFMLFVGGMSWKYILAGAIASPLLALAFWEIVAEEHHKMRILVLTDIELQEAERLGMFFQQWQGLIALNSGGLTGQGFFGGEYMYMFAIHNDFIFAYIGMVAGFIGCVASLALLLLICIKMLSVSGLARDCLGRMICCGVFAMLFLHTTVNVAMVTATGPVVGIQLPFYSAGGSSTLAQWTAVGLVLSVWAHRKKEYHMFYEEE